MIVHDTKKILNKYQVYAKKMFGQNFLINEDVLDDIIRFSNINKETSVIEIGPGLGTLTEYLAKNAKKVISYEIDKDMVMILEETLNDYDNIKIINKDFLKVNLENDIKEYISSKDIKAIANVPYYITTPILFKLLENNKINEYLFMVQEEVGRRLTGKPNTKDYNALSVIMAYKTKSEIVRKVGRNCFFPAPNVDSVLLNVKIVKNDYSVKNEANFFEFVEAIFNQRRKTVVNNISMKYKLEKDKIAQKLDKLGININTRAEALNINEIIDVYNKLFN